MATHHDGMLVVELAKWGSQIGLDEALRVVLAEHYDPEQAMYDETHVQTILQFGETVATLTKNGALDEAIVLDWLWVSGMWARVAPAAIGQRNKLGVAELFENFEALAAKQD
jgi:hypothetical protein